MLFKNCLKTAKIDHNLAMIPYLLLLCLVSTKKQSVKSTLTVKSWKLVVGDQELINGPLWQTVKPDESFWAIESPGVLSMTLEKVCGQNLWPVKL